jgi:hypothetical protein
MGSRISAIIAEWALCTVKLMAFALLGEAALVAACLLQSAPTPVPDKGTL